LDGGVAWACRVLDRAKWQILAWAVAKMVAWEWHSCLSPHAADVPYGGVIKQRYAEYKTYVTSGSGAVEDTARAPAKNDDAAAARALVAAPQVEARVLRVGVGVKVVIAPPCVFHQ
jgi:hypothetical protein